MKPLTTNQEILLFKGTSFSKFEFAIRDNHKKRPGANSAGEELEKACWEGKLSDILPELTIDPIDGYKMYVWNIHATKRSLLIQLGTDPCRNDTVFSIDPLYILPGTNFT
ncbi:MAG TPA: hypothetical protein VJ765_16660 [Chitinophagaceae bacterium]|nr:hypothetical protein [Chitinophagaceae bacterium]